MPTTPPRLVATLGPASSHLAAELVAAGATALRINASHLSQGALTPLLDALRRVLPDVPVVVDLQGAKMRVGTFEPRTLAAGDTVRFCLSPHASPGIPVEHPELFRALRPGDTLSLDDDRLRMRVHAVRDEEFEAQSLVGGVLRPRKGLNVVDHPIGLDALSVRDMDHILGAERFVQVEFAFSFMLDGSEAAWIRSRAPRAKVVGKIERAEAIEGVGAIARACDEVWICRGDLGAQRGAAGLARFVAAFRPASVAAPVLMAGQVLEHLTRHADPTRSEVCHLFDLLGRGYAGIVLSDETAIGVDPVHAVRTARSLLDTLMP